MNKKFLLPFVVVYFLTGTLWASYTVIQYQRTCISPSYSYSYGIANFVRTIAWPIAIPFDLWWITYGPGN